MAFPLFLFNWLEEGYMLAIYVTNQFIFA
jgi:hypothetical protein